MKVNNKNMNINKVWNIYGEIPAGKYYISLENETTKYPVKITPLSDEKPEGMNVNIDKPDEIEQKILDDGYIVNNNLHRRWIMAQMFRHYKENDGKTCGFDHHFVTGTRYKYAWETAMNEIKALRHLHGDELKKRERFFNMDVVKEMAKELEERTKQNYWYEKNEFLSILKEVYKAKNYFEMYKALKKLVGTYAMQSISHPKPKAWKNAFKGAGAYYTMDNMIKFHNCRWRNEYGNMMSLKESLNELEKAVDRNRNTYYKLYAIMCNFIEYNHFDFDKRMKEIYDKKAV